MKFDNSLRMFTLLLAPIFGGACLLQSIGPAGTPQVEVVTATPDGAAIPEPQTQSASTPEWTRTPEAAFTPSLTATFTETPVTLTAGQDLSCVKGPDWKLYEWVTKIPKGVAVTLVARAVPEIPDYYVARTGDGKECWAFGGSSTIDGNAASLPVRETPPLPTVQFVVRSRVYNQLTYLYIRKAGDSGWGPNRLTAPLLMYGAEASVSITAGYYDVHVVDVFSHWMYEAYNRAIGPDDTYRILEVATDVNFTIRNDYAQSICWIEVEPPGGTWQKLYATEDGGGPILTGQTRDFTLRAGTYGVRVYNCAHAVIGLMGLYFYPGVPTFALS